MSNKPTNAEIQEIKNKLDEVSAMLFVAFGGENSLYWRVSVNDIQNSLRTIQKENAAQGDNTVNFIY